MADTLRLDHLAEVSITEPEEIDAYETLLYMGDRRLKENYEDLRKIVAAIKEKNIEKARALARNHVARFTKYMRKKERQE